MNDYIVFCSTGRHAIGSIPTCGACRKYREKAVSKHKQQQTEASSPIINASTQGLYRDEFFWIFNYPDETERAQAIQEYEEEQELWDLIMSLPVVREEDDG